MNFVLILSRRKLIYFRKNSYRFLSDRGDNFSKTVLLPKTKFPHRIDSSKRFSRDQEILEKAKFSSLYDWQLENNKHDMFILHDGPPYANGELHMGHAINKILKDITNRYKILRGYKVHYVPGWDCHGLPIEMKAIDTDVLDRFHSPLEIISKAKKYAERVVKEQRKSFLQWGIIGDWNNCYKTLDSSYVTRQLELFYQLYKKGLIFRDYKPTYWSPVNRTALAEAELEYHEDHQSLSVYVKFPLVNVPDFLKNYLNNGKVHGVIWTTTPWTLPANQAIGFASNKDYCLAKIKSNSTIIIGSDLISDFEKTLGIELQILTIFQGNLLKNVMYSHPLNQSSKFPFVENSFVSMSKGTGLVHMAPNHGHEDYSIALQNKIPITKCIVDEDGCFTKLAGEELDGLNIFTTGTETVLKLFKDYVLHTTYYEHSYPYDWRSKKPVIIRASRQWFFNTDCLKPRVLSCLDNVSTHPPIAKKLLYDTIKNCPLWCISRQRVWGVPVPIFYRLPNEEPVLTRPIIDHLKQLFTDKNIDCWWSLSEEELLPEKVLKASQLPINDNYRRGNDILDIWFDSGISWYNVIPNDHIADFYMEGIDQVRGWFQSSLWTSVAMQDKPPYKSLFIHGFALDSKGRKMSKSVGNVVSPNLIIKGDKSNPSYGIDVLRWWVAAHACHFDNCLVSDHVIKECAENLNKIRNVFRFLIGNLNQFDTVTNLRNFESLNLVDRYMLHLIYNFMKEMAELYDNFNYGHITRRILNFVTNDISFYFNTVKDRLYCEEQYSETRLSCQTTFYHILTALTSVLAPFTPHLVEEVYQYLPNSQEIFKIGWKKCSDKWLQEDVAEILYAVQSIKSAINKITDINPREFDAIIHTTDDLYNCLKMLHNDKTCTDSLLCELLQMSQITLTNHLPEAVPKDAKISYGNVILSQCHSDNPIDFKVFLLSAKLKFCSRCRRYASKKENELCPRCSRVLESFKLKAVV
ncbi:isoleucine--tRNA ligase, mitochondrial-like [Centruroides sculpturatus]|uniref:isoleucine--tRNA ligase, mitochondrial-like n=1 Tax=Centruroides sculpturatus TaxID=218467 RepID=UPI000C6D4AC4|nr:isoleucine--tRNA ligase, mitochondrial-like [Centruroides sculpturatus]